MVGLAKNLSSKEARNEKRREEYRQNESYRRTCTEESRENYRRENGVVLKTCIDNLHSLADFGTVRELRGDNPVSVLTFTVHELAEILGYSATILYRWKGKELIPGPVFDAKTEMFSKSRNVSFESNVKVYLAEEVSAFVEIIGAHQQEFCYYRKSDTEVARKLFAKVAQVRQKHER